MRKTGLVFVVFVLISVSSGGGIVWASVSDERIESSARETFIFREFLKDDDVQVESKDGVVTLRGTVSEESHITLAENAVDGLPGVKKVNNHLKIEGDLSDKSSDLWLTTKIKTALLFHRNVSGIHTEVNAKDGVVTLEGEAERTLEKDLTTEYVKEVDGVKEVINKMTVSNRKKDASRKVSEVVDDASITSLVKMTLQFHRSTDANNTEVETNKGIVKLAGRAKSEAQKDLTEKVVSDVRGVRSVINNITVDESLSKNN